MVERFFLDGVDAETGGPAIGRQYDLIVLSHAYETGAALALVQFAVTRTQVTLYAAVIQPVPVSSGMVRAAYHGVCASAGVTKSLSFHLSTV